MILNRLCDGLGVYGGRVIFGTEYGMVWWCHGCSQRGVSDL